MLTVVHLLKPVPASFAVVKFCTERNGLSPRSEVMKDNALWGFQHCNIVCQSIAVLSPPSKVPIPKL